MHVGNGVLTPGVVTTVTLDQAYQNVEVLNRNGLGEIFFRLDGVAPVVGANDNYIVAAAISAALVQAPTGANSVVQLISNAACTYTVQGTS